MKSYFPYLLFIFLIIAEAVFVIAAILTNDVYVASTFISLMAISYISAIMLFFKIDECDRNNGEA